MTLARVTHRRLPGDLQVALVEYVSSLVADWSRKERVTPSSRAIERAQLLYLLVVCEGVETSEQYHHVADLGSDYCQG